MTVTDHLAVGPPVPIGSARRALDVLVAAGALVCGAPVLALLALAVRITSRGPVIFRQVRVGAGGRPFTLYKFRTMRVTTGGPEVTTGGDARITAVGRVLRAASMDELPQLLNILQGEMTLVGPRPETFALAARYSAKDMAVFRYRPGLTGPAQVRQRDSRVLPAHAADVEDLYLTRLVPLRVALDMEYLADPTLSRTVRMMVETAAHVLGLDRPVPAMTSPAPSTSRSVLP